MCYNCSLLTEDKYILATSKVTTADFIAKSNKKHGFRYDYSQSEYLKTSAPIRIGCPDHGFFSQLPRNHLRGAGCPACAVDARAEKGQSVGNVKKKQLSGQRFFPPGAVLKLPFWD